MLHIQVAQSKQEEGVSVVFLQPLRHQNYNLILIFWWCFWFSKPVFLFDFGIYSKVSHPHKRLFTGLQRLSVHMYLCTDMHTHTRRPTHTLLDYGLLLTDSLTLTQIIESSASHLISPNPIYFLTCSVPVLQWAWTIFFKERIIFIAHFGI